MDLGDISSRGLSDTWCFLACLGAWHWSVCSCGANAAGGGPGEEGRPWAGGHLRRAKGPLASACLCSLCLLRVSPTLALTHRCCSGLGLASAFAAPSPEPPRCPITGLTASWPHLHFLTPHGWDGSWTGWSQTLQRSLVSPGPTALCFADFALCPPGSDSGGRPAFLLAAALRRFHAGSAALCRGGDPRDLGIPWVQPRAAGATERRPHPLFLGAGLWPPKATACFPVRRGLLGSSWVLPGCTTSACGPQPGLAAQPAGGRMHWHG